MKFIRARLVWLLILLVCIAILYVYFRRVQLVDVVEVTQGPMVQSVVTIGRIASVARTDVASQSTARIEAILVREGDVVTAHQVLVRLRDDEANANLVQADAAVAEARAHSPVGDGAGACECAITRAGPRHPVVMKRASRPAWMKKI